MTDPDSRKASPPAARPRPGTLEALRYERLEARLEELRKLREYVNSRRPEVESGSDTDYVEKSLDACRDAIGRGALQVAWAHCHQADRFLLQEVDDECRQTRRKLLRREAEEKLGNWRKEAVLDVVGREVEQKGPLPPCSLALAQGLLDQHFDNVYFKLEAVAIRIRNLPYVLVPLVVLLIAVSSMLDPSQSEFFLFDLQETALVLLVGAIGATLSNTLSVLGVAGRIPAFLGGAGAWLVRPLLGALSAIAVLSVVQSGVLPFTGAGEGLSLYGWAVVAGFSDQLLTRVMRGVEKAAEN